MPNTPQAARLRRQQVIDWLVTEGLTEYEVRKLMTSGVIRPRHMRPKTKAYYDRDQIRTAVLENENFPGEPTKHKETTK